MKLHPLAGRRAPPDLLVDVDRLRREYSLREPDVADNAQRVSFDTGGHRGSSLRGSFNEAHVHAVFDALFEQQVSLEGMLLKPNMVMSGKRCATQASVNEVALATVRCLRRHAPAAVPGIVFLSGGQDHLVATKHLSAINQVAGPKPWKLTYSYGRALQDEALNAWRGRQENLAAAQQAFNHRAKCDSAAALGEYTTSLETESLVA